MLGSHPRLFAPPELYLLAHDRVHQWQKEAGAGRGYHIEGVIQALMQIHNSTLEDAERLLQSYIDEDKTTQQLYHEFQYAIAPRLLVDKTPSYAHSLDILRMAETEFQAPLYLHLVRHPQAVIRSYEDVRFGQRNPLLHEFTLSPRTFAEWTWRIGHENILEFLQEVPQARWHRLYFEELVKAPQQTMEQICNFLGLDFHPAMLQPYRDPSQQMTQGIHALTTMAGDPKFHHHTRIDPAVADAWKDRESTIQVSPQTWAIAEKLGYAQASSPLSKPMSPNGSEWNLQRILSEIESLPEQEASQLFAAEISGGQR